MKTLALVAGFTAALVWIGPTLLDGPSEQQAAQDIANDMAEIDRQFNEIDHRLERSARHVCEFVMGRGASHEWGPDNDLVCVPPILYRSKTGAL